MNLRVTFKLRFGVKLFITLFAGMFCLQTAVFSQYVVCQRSLLSEGRLTIFTLKSLLDLAMASLMQGQVSRRNCLKITKLALVRLLGFLFDFVFILDVLSVSLPLLGTLPV